MGKGPLIVFLHGFPEFWYSWRHQIPFFLKHFKVAVPDMRGFGETERPTEVDEYRIERLVTDIVELVHSLGQEKATVVGHDWGGVIARSIGIMAPNIVENLIIMNAPHPAVFQRNAFRNYQQMQKSWYMFFFLLQNVPERILSRNNFELLKYLFKISMKRKKKFTQMDIEGYVMKIDVMFANINTINIPIRPRPNFKLIPGLILFSKIQLNFRIHGKTILIEI